jgi:CHAT domain-containing protein/tetratricopeptide (TPR) repeat protein
VIRGLDRSSLLGGLLLLVLASPADFLHDGSCLAAGERQEPRDSTRSGQGSPLETMRRLVADGSYAQAESLARQFLQQEQQAGRGESKQVAEAMLVLVETLWRGGKEKDPETRETAERCIEINRKVFGEEHANFATSLSNLAVVLRRSDDPEGAKTLQRRVLALREKIFGPHSMEVALTLSNMAAPEGMSGNFPAARALLERALSICEELGARDAFATNVLYNLGTLNDTLGDFAKSRDYHVRALEIRRRTLSPDHPLTAASSYGLAIALTQLGDFAAARTLYEQSLSIQEKALGPDHPEFAESLSNLAVVLARTGHFADAKPLQERALAILERALGSEHTRTSDVRSDLAALLANMGDLAEAKRLMEVTVSNQERVLGPVQPDLGRSLNRLADVELRLGLFPSAEQHLQRAQTILEKVYGVGHPETAVSLHGLGRLRYVTGRYVPAESFFQKALAVRRTKLGETHPAVAEELTGLAGVHWALGDARRAFEESLQAEDILGAHFGRSLRGLSEREALEYERVRASGLNTALSVLASAAPRELPEDGVERAWMALVRSRALVLDQMAGLHRTTSAREDPETVGLVRDLVAATNRVATLIVRGPEPARPDLYVAELQGATQERETLERRLAEKSASFRMRIEQDRSTLEELRKSLPRTTALVAYALYDKSAPRAPEPRKTDATPLEAVPAYMAFVLGPHLKRPVSIPLGSAEEIDRLVGEWRQASASPPGSLGAAREDHDRELRDIGRRLRARLWDPVDKELAGQEQVLVVPDGAVNLISFATLPVDEDRFLIESGPVFHYLSAERDLLSLAQAGPTKGSGIMVLGGPDFDAGPGTLRESSTGRSSRSPAPTAESGSWVARRYRSPAASCGSFRTLRFDPLPASTREVAEIRAVVDREEDASGPAASNVIELTKTGASEDAFKSLAPGRRVLHLATHGFFLGDRCLSSLSSPGQTESDRPLLLSGLALAGANRRGEAGPDEEDGILTSEEIATLDLSGVEWVVLSACESGLGRIQSGEGVLGLRRAFQVAGARTLITSLWKVEDESTREWMRHLYEGRLDGMSTAEAVRHASLAILQARRAMGRSTHPFFWGAFAAAGDWR